MVKKLLGILVLGLLFCNQSFVLSETIEDNNLITDEEIFKNATPLELYSGRTIEDNGITYYYSTKKNKYISCKAFNDEGSYLEYAKDSKELRFEFVQPSCEDVGVFIFSGDGEEFTITMPLTDRLKKHSNLIIIISIISILVFFLIRFKDNISRSIKSLFRKIKSSKKDWKRIMLTLSILYLCIMYYLNWWGHQGGMFIYKLTYTWFLRWGLIPVVSGWIIYYIWRKEK